MSVTVPLGQTPTPVKLLCSSELCTFLGWLCPPKKSPKMTKTGLVSPGGGFLGNPSFYYEMKYDHFSHFYIYDYYYF